MSSKRRIRKFKSPRIPVPPTPPKVPVLHIKLALGGTDFHAGSALLKTALLYGDTVTIYSPGSVLLKSIIDFAKIRDPQEQLLAIWNLADAVPTLQKPDMAAPAAQELRRAMQADPKFLAKIRSAAKHTQDLTELAHVFDSIGGVWTSNFTQALEDISSSIGAGDMIAAINRGLVKVDPLSGGLSRDGFADSLRLATGLPSNGSSDKMVEEFLGRSLEILAEPKSFPLFDESSTGLVRAFSNMVGFDLSVRAIGKAREVATASSFMTYLPGFPSLPLSEIIDLRKDLAGPLSRFRVAVMTISKTFESGPFDSSFDAEVLESWRATVEPTMLEVRESLAEHKLLREARSIALGDPRRLIAEAGAAFAAGSIPLHGLNLGKLSAIFGAGAPLVDLIGRSVHAKMAGQRSAKSNAFYFLHRVREAALRN